MNIRALIKFRSKEHYKIINVFIIILYLTEAIFDKFQITVGLQ